MQTAQLVPVSQWVYDLYKVVYWSGDPDVAGSRQVGSRSIAASSEGHMNAEAWDNSPGDHAEFMTWEIVKQDVGQPRVVGQMYGINVYESGSSHGRRLAEQM